MRNPFLRDASAVFLLPHRTPLARVLLLSASALPILGCSSLTRPDDITITPEPLAAPAPPPQPAPIAPAQGPTEQPAPQAGG